LAFFAELLIYATGAGTVFTGAGTISSAPAD